MAARNVPSTEVMPTYLMPYAEQDTFNEYDVPGGEPIAKVTVKGKTFGVRYEGESLPMLDERGYAMQYFDVIVVEGKPGMSKAFYLSGYQEGNVDRPDCSSLDGVEPDPASQAIQAARCMSCPQNRFGTGANGKSKACQDYKRLAVVPYMDPVNERFGGPMLLHVTPGSFAAFRTYAGMLKQQNKPMHLVITRLSFDPQAAHPSLQFECVGWLPQEHAEVVMGWRDHEHTDRVLYVYADGDGGAEDAGTSQAAGPAVEARPAPAVQVPPPRPVGAPRPTPAPAARVLPPLPPPAPARAPAPAAAMNQSPAPAKAPTPAPRRPAARTAAAPPPPPPQAEADLSDDGLNALISGDDIMAALDGDFNIPE